MMGNKKKILVAPLDWGIGHAARCIPLIDDLLDQGNEVILAGNGRSIAWLEKRFARLTCLKDIPDYRIQFSAKASISLQLLKQWPRLKHIIQDEHNWLDQVIDAYHIDEVISDNRYGLHSKKIKCSLVTHQLRVHAAWFVAPFANRMIGRLLCPFSEILIPDFENYNDSLSGKLSHPPLQNCRYIGALSRFSPTRKIHTEKATWVGIVSGPEPFRTEFENELFSLFQRIGQPSFILAANPQNHGSVIKGNVTILSHAEDDEFASLVSNATHVIARAGFSTVLDLNALGADATLVPTPGQTEQEYLGQYLSSKKKFKCISQEKMKSLSAKDFLNPIR